MALSTYSDLTSSVASFLHRSDLTSQIPDFITLSESLIWNKLRVRQMETTMATVMASGVIAIPTNYIQLKQAYISSTSPYGPLERVTIDFIYNKYPSRVADRQPVFIAREVSNFIFGPYPDSNYTVTFVYYNKLAALSSATNSIWTSYPGLWLYGALLQAAPFLKNDSRIPVWQTKFDQLIALVQRESDGERESGGPLMIQAL